MNKKISKVIIYYEDGTYEEVKASADYAQNKPHTPNVNPSPVNPFQWPQQVQPNQPTWAPQYTRDTTWPFPITCGTDSGTYRITSTSNLSPDNKYSITSTGNGNVDLSK